MLVCVHHGYSLWRSEAKEYTANAGRLNLTNVSIEAYDPAGEFDTYPWVGAIPTGATAPVLVGRSRYDGNLTINNLDMAEGLLYVDGDVTITGTVKGKGAIVATGKITVTGSMDTNADHAALVAKGDITIHGNGPASSKFQGLVYSEGSIDIARTTIMGAAVSQDTVGTTKLEEVKAISVPELTAMNFDQHVTLEKAKDNALSAFKDGDPDPIGIRYQGVFTQLAPKPDTEALKALGDALKNLDPGPESWQFGKMRSTGFDPTPIDKTRAYDAASTNWDRYLDENKAAQIEVVEIFDIDLNTLISLDVKLEMMYHTTVRTDRNRS